jgi:hypothetical protein
MSTALDAAHAEMQAAPDDEGARLRWYGALLDQELVVVLEGEPAGGGIVPRVFPLAEGPVILAFDNEEKLASALGAAPYAALPGRAVVAALAGQGTGLGVNLGAAGAFLMDAAGVDWLAGVLAAAPVADLSAADRFEPAAPPAPLVAALDAGLARARGRAASAFLAARAGRLIVVFAGAASPAPLARLVGEAAAFSGAGVPVDAGFLPAGVPAPLAAVRVWDLSPPPPAASLPPAPPGPPRLR